MAECSNCGSHVTEQYVKIFGDRNDEVDTCLHCIEGSRVDERETAGLNPIDTWSN